MLDTQLGYSITAALTCATYFCAGMLAAACIVEEMDIAMLGTQTAALRSALRRQRLPMVATYSRGS